MRYFVICLYPQCFIISACSSWNGRRIRVFTNYRETTINEFLSINSKREYTLFLLGSQSWIQLILVIATLFPLLLHFVVFRCNFIAWADLDGFPGVRPFGLRIPEIPFLKTSILAIFSTPLKGNAFCASVSQTSFSKVLYPQLWPTRKRLLFWSLHTSFCACFPCFFFF